MDGVKRVAGMPIAGSGVGRAEAFPSVIERRICARATDAESLAVATGWEMPRLYNPNRFIIRYSVVRSTPKMRAASAR